MSFMQVIDLKVHYPIRGGFFNTIVDWVYAVDGIDMEFEQGKTYGLVGESGCGKSTTGKAIIGLEKITSGKILFEGEDVTRERRSRTSRFHREVQMIFQDSHSSLNPRKRIADILAEPIRNFLHLTPREESRKIGELLEIVGLPQDAKEKYPHEFSGGQKQRINIARALATHPKMIIADEPVSALDLSVQAQVLNFMKDVQREFGLTYLFISHDLGVVKHMCDTIFIMYKGRFVERGTKEDIYGNSKHLYTKRLLSSIPATTPVGREKRKRARKEFEKVYEKMIHKAFDQNGRVYDLIPVSDTHYVSAPSARELLEIGKESEMGGSR
ncbi:ATP-binding cassette domain-containing protein [Ureibacillus sp. FSL K6-8385]|uniref:ABC transporter ATP-binding protein n=1 Tax=Ureibacillus terrenus TaxID=118246 RepID=A0A540V3S6_9BACL|nr:ATP-binding cassette domain-containing protein [Ureibacillus terrenus]MED3661806.1 ATP-binding cassette domain-containing protein [Ureibacillus terrenus]MED3763109.1 ATP-binding cassette domain-containing protein [Ureibacillus terrenus]TQE91381.1 ABC transporter ATP-binding protein [Ureibacillus terrenus]